MRARGIKLYGLLLLWSAWQAPGAWAQQDTLRTEGTRAAVQADTVATDSVAAGNALPAADVAAAENKAAADTTLSEVDSLKQAKMFNALKYSMQKRFRPKDEVFVVGSFWDHTFVSLAGGVEKWVPRQGVEFSLGPTFYASFGKWWRPYHGVRVSLAGGTFVRCSDSEKLAAVGLDVAHLFNLNAYLGGYKRGRFLEISTVEGIGYRYSSIGGEGAHALDVHLGLNLNLHLGARMDFFVEPRVAFYGDGIDHSADVNWHGYDVGYGGVMGLTYRFLPEGSEFPGSRSGVEEETFLSVAVGQQFQLSDLVQEMGIGNSLGTHVGVSWGKWLTSMFAMRVSCFMGSDKWREYEDGSDDKTRYLGLRVEGMLDLCALVRGKRGNFSLPLLFGPEIGAMNKAEREDNLRRAYLGLTGGLQLKYRVLENVSLFLEPRYSLVPYSHSVPSEIEGRGDIRTNYYDDVFNFNIGVEFRVIND